jgi:hypothetical protein
MMKWIVAGITAVTLSLGGAALATKDMSKDVGVTGCAKCHDGSPKAKKLKPKMAEHLKACKTKKASETCKSCHAGKPKGKAVCK